MTKSFLAVLALMLACSISIRADEFFEVSKVLVETKPPHDGRGIWHTNTKMTKDKVFVPSVEAIVRVTRPIRSGETIARAHFFDREGKHVATASAPSLANRGGDIYAAPSLYVEKESIFFEIPKSLCDSAGWRVVVVFGDRNGVAASGWPDASVFLSEFPEKHLLNRTRIAKPKIARDPVIERVVTTSHPKHPKITLFLRLPNGAKSGSDVNGVLAMCVLANNIEELRRKLQSENPGAEIGALATFADERKLAIICWGSRQLWEPGASYDELDRRRNYALDDAFDIVANAWERGIEDLHKTTGIPARNFLLWGVCGSAQWAHRLALRKPDRFLAAYIHMPSSFDRPTAEAANMLWLLTVGELDSGYERGSRFFQDCRAMGYPMIFKGIMGLGHAGSPVADELGLALFDYALSLKEAKIYWEKAQFDRLRSSVLDVPKDWRQEFFSPEYYGDFLNQGIVPSSEIERIPKEFRVPLPTQKLARVWDK